MEHMNIPSVSEISSITDRSYLEQLHSYCSERFNDHSQNYDRLHEEHRPILKKHDRYRSVPSPSTRDYFVLGALILLSGALFIFPFAKYISAGTTLFTLLRLLRLLFPLAAAYYCYKVGKPLVLRRVYRLSKAEKKEYDEVSKELSILHDKIRYYRHIKHKIFSRIETLNQPTGKRDIFKSSSAVSDSEEYLSLKKQLILALNNPSVPRGTRITLLNAMIELERSALLLSENPTPEHENQQS